MAMSKTEKRTFGRNLKAARIRCALTQVELSEKIESSVYAIRLYEQGRCLPSAENLHEIVTALGITTADLFEGVAA
jgi:transcriptional regulator with XRE-family HTH domain